jgi:MSHA biogenesis protein MshO
MRLQRGFSLIELVMVIILLGIIAAIMAPIITSSVTAYQDTRARQELLARGRLALDRLARDIHRAVPNSLRTVAGSSDTIEFVTASSGGRYLDRDDDLISAANCPTARRFRTGFALSQLCLLHPGGTQPAISTGDILTIGNTSPDFLENGITRVTVTSVTDASPLWTVGFATFTFTEASPGKHYAVADAVHEVGLVSNALRWRRNNGIAAAEYDNALDIAAADTLLIDGVDALLFRYDSAADGMLKVDLSLSDSGEQVDLYEEIYVRNTP